MLLLIRLALVERDEFVYSGTELARPQLSHRENLTVTPHAINHVTRTRLLRERSKAGTWRAFCPIPHCRSRHVA